MVTVFSTMCERRSVTVTGYVPPSRSTVRCSSLPTGPRSRSATPSAGIAVAADAVDGGDTVAAGKTSRGGRGLRQTMAMRTDGPSPSSVTPMPP